MKKSSVFQLGRIACVAALCFFSLSTLVSSSTASASAKQATRPSSPRSVVATVDKSSVVVHWEKPASNGGSTIEHYVAVSIPGLRDCVSQETNCTFTDLLKGTKYTFKVLAVNAVGTSTLSAPSRPVSPSTPTTTTTSPLPTTTTTIPAVTTTLPTSGGSAPTSTTTSTTLPTSTTTSTTTTSTLPTSTTTTTFLAPTTTTTALPTTTTAPVTTTTFSAAPLITLEPSSLSELTFGNATFGAEATGTPTPTIQWQVSQNSGITWSAIEGATSTSFVPLSSTLSNGYEYRAIFTNTSGSTTTTPATLTVLNPTTIWSGYADFGSDGQFSAVSANWIVPQITCTGTATDTSQWVGIDGYGESYVEQDGLDYWCQNGASTVSYGVWYEMYGNDALNDGASIPISPSKYPVAQGDEVGASISFASGQWTFQLEDLTKGWTFSVNVASPTPPDAEATAEFILEGAAPGVNGYYPLSVYSTTTFFNCSITSNGIAGPITSAQNQAIAMTLGSTVLTEAGALNTAGTSFTDTMVNDN